MKNRSNIWTIVRKEFARFFGDRTMVFTVLLMPGLLIYCIYSLIGNNMEKQFSPDETTPTTVFVENLPASVAPLFDSLPYTMVESDFNPLDIIHDSLGDKHCSLVYLSFPANFDTAVACYDPQCGEPAPNVKIYYNSSSPNSQAAFYAISGVLNAWEESIANRFNINAQMPDDEETFDVADQKDTLGDLLSQLVPMLLLMLMFSGCMAVAPAAIAGEKERGTIATLLVTPMKRSELAIGKILSLSCFALLSGLSSFIGVMLSLPKMLHSDELGGLSLGYTMGDYVSLLLVLLSTVLVLISCISLISAYAKSVKAAGTMITPLMLILMFVGFMPMLSPDATPSLALYLVPFYNSIEAMASILAFESSAQTVLTTVVANLLYTALAVFGLTKMFNSERVMFGR